MNSFILENQYSMKLTKANVYKKQLYLFFFLLGISLLIWYLGPHIPAIPLKTPEQRVYVIAIFYLAWILKFFLLDLMPPESPKSTVSEMDKKIAHLKGKFQGAIDFLKKTVIEKHGKKINLAHLPWYLIIGPKGAGKTTLLAKSTIHFILAKVAKDKAITPSDSCDFWVTRDLVLVDIPGSYQSEKKGAADAGRLWHYLLKLIHQFHKHKSIPGIIVTLNLPELIKEERTKKNQTVYDLKKQLIDLWNEFKKPLHLHIVITKCDLLPGFNEYFSECTRDELIQAWGVGIPSIKKNENVIDVFTERFNALIKRLNSQLITRLHQERNAEMRSLIKDFPLHIERLKETIAQLIKALKMPQVHFQSVHLTSACQEPPEEKPTYLADNALHQSLPMLSQPHPPTRAYFIRQLLLHHLNPTIIETKSPARRLERRLIYATAFGVIVTAGVWLVRDFEYSVEQTYAIQNSLAEYQQMVQESTDPSERLMRAIPLLNALQNAANQSPEKWLTFYSQKPQRTAVTIYHQALQTLIFPEIKNIFETYLEKASTKNPEQVYAVLTAYLMLNDPAHFSANYITSQLHQLIPTTENPEVIAEITTHIDAALKTSEPTIKPNLKLVTQVQKQLTHLSHSNLGFVLLKNMENNNVDSLVSLGTQLGNPPLFTSKAVLTEIPSMFTEKEFLKITEEEVQIAATQVIRGNWVLGQNPLFTDEATINALAAELRSEYIAKYVDIWESLLANLTLVKPKNLMQVTQMVATLTGNHSPLLQVLDTIKQNTAFAPIKAASPKLQNLSVLLVDANSNPNNLLYQIFVSLQSLNTYLQNIMQATDQPSALFAATAKRMQAADMDPINSLFMIAEQSPEPMKTWLTSLAMETWECMLQDTAVYIENTWQKSIMPIYLNSIANRYPFDQKSTDEINLQQFIAFLGEPGVLTSFYQTFLKPFVNTDKQWHWQSVNNRQLPFTDFALERLEQASRIQRAFFPNGDNKLYVPFTLQPVTLDHKIKSVTFNINGQEIRYLKDQQNSARLLTWPGTNTLHETSVNFISLDNQLLSSSIKGDWGWFRLVTNATKTVRSRKEIELLFKIDGHTAKYILFTEGHFNPFLPLNFERFALPQKLST